VAAADDVSTAGEDDKWKETGGMPAHDGTGPNGLGSMTGRGWGFCILKTDPCESNAVVGFAGIDGKPLETTNNNTSALALRAAAVEKEVGHMPGGDGTGPGGMGPMTGRAAGFCAGNPTPGYANAMPGRGFGFGRGRGFGYGRGLGLGFRGGRAWGAYQGAPYAAPAYPYYGTAVSPYSVPYGAGPTSEQEAEMLKGQAERFEDALDGIKKRIAELEAKTEQKK
jgi:hypothetical protein